MYAEELLGGEAGSDGSLIKMCSFIPEDFLLLRFSRQCTVKTEVCCVHCWCVHSDKFVANSVCNTLQFLQVWWLLSILHINF